jgi:glycosyltransferase involved in cell wall biosynthesis
MQNKILIITHEASRTGAPLVMLHFLKWLKVNKPEIMVDVLALKGGALESDFKVNCNEYYNYQYFIKPNKISLFNRVLLKFKLVEKVDNEVKFIKKICQKKYNLIYANTIVALPIATRLVSESKSSKLIAHVHELNAIIRAGLPSFKSLSKSINQFIAPSQLVKKNLIDNWSISANIIDVVYECANIEVSNTSDLNRKKEAVFTVGASGTVHWRKGHDVFLQLARYINSNYPDYNINFEWVGRIPENEKIILEEDLNKLDLKERIVFTREVENPSKYFSNFDVFVMTSREDPFPLVCIEVGMLGKPIISFDKAVGTNEILKEAGGYIVPYLNIELMSEKIIDYYNNPELIVNHGNKNKKAFSQFTPEIICPELYSVIEKTMS